MKRRIGLLVFLLIAAPLASADLFFQPATSTINVGDPISIDVMFSGAASPWLAGYDLFIGYNPTILHLAAVAWPDDNLGVPSLRDAIFGTGTVEVTESSLASGAALEAAQSGNDPFRLFQLLFSGEAAPGVSPLTLDQVLLVDGNGQALDGGSARAGSVTVRGNAVPEPAGLLLLLIPWFGSIVLQRRRV